MLRRLVRKMINNKRMVICQLTGLVLAVAMISSVPIYTDGVMQRMLTKDLENYQISSGHYPGTYYFEEKLYNIEKSECLERIKNIDNVINNQFIKEIGLPVIDHNMVLTNDFLKATPEDAPDGKSGKSIKIEAYKDIENHIKIIQGKLPSEKKVGDLYEVMVSQNALYELDLLVGKTYNISDIMDNSGGLKVKIVGAYTVKDNKDPYWHDGSWQLPGSFIINYEAFNNEYIKEKIASTTNVEWYYALDYHKIKVSDLTRLSYAVEIQAESLRSTYDLMPSLSILQKYAERAKLLKTTLWVIQIPVLIMLIFYLFMVSQLIIEQEKNEIAVLKSRGASRRHIVKDYFIQGVILCGIALIIGPLVGLMLCRIIGASNGFLQFVSRTRLPVALNITAYIYSLIALVFFILTMLIPAVLATKTTIVLHKQKNARKRNLSLWKKYFIDVLLLGISLYGLYTYKTRQDILKITGVKGSEIPIDPLLFLISALFILAFGMFFLRVFPYIVMFIFKTGRKVWPPVAYTSLVNASRAGGKDGFIILFLIMTISVGIFNANAARTINTNVEERVRYSTGADITLTEKWDNDEISAIPGAPPGMGQQSAVTQKPVTYVEPPFLPFTKLSGVESAAKVFRKKDAISLVGNKAYSNTYVMGIDSHEFGETAWFRTSLLPYHWYEYLNVLTRNQAAFIVSNSFKKQYNARIGDMIYVKWGENDYVPGIIFAFVDYWPTFNPYEKSGASQQQNLIVANLSYLQGRTRLEPYEVWMKTSEGASSSQVYKDIEDKKLPIISLKDSKQLITEKKNDPMLQGTNGALTMGFLVTMIISTIGFLIYWILSIEGRILQFGIFRAMGMSLKKVIGILVFEQLIISGSAIIMGVIAGGISSDLFIPLLQIVYSSAEQIPSFRVVAVRGDYVKLYLIILFMLTLGFAVLGRLISTIKISQAVKLGED